MKSIRYEDRFKKELPPPEKPFETIRLYKKAKQLLVVSSNFVGDMPKKHKFIAGARLQDLCLTLCSNVAKAYNEGENVKLKIAYQKKVQTNINDILILYRLINSLCLIGHDLYIEHLKIIHDASVQAADWVNKTQREARPELDFGVSSSPSVPQTRT